MLEFRNVSLLLRRTGSKLVASFAGVSLRTAAIVFPFIVATYVFFFQSQNSCLAQSYDTMNELIQLDTEMNLRRFHLALALVSKRPIDDPAVKGAAKFYYQSVYKDTNLPQLDAIFKNIWFRNVEMIGDRVEGADTWELLNAEIDLYQNEVETGVWARFQSLENDELQKEFLETLGKLKLTPLDLASQYPNFAYEYEPNCQGWIMLTDALYRKGGYLKARNNGINFRR